ncbi:unnamed protein product [Linum trigynum]|uniref:Uncharacterized protein n=1 Tax=Linum trigynum TaxID=586398 RepID=A0AAV2F502_9ROSI
MAKMMRFYATTDPLRCCTKLRRSKLIVHQSLPSRIIFLRSSISSSNDINNFSSAQQAPLSSSRMVPQAYSEIMIT